MTFVYRERTAEQWEARLKQGDNDNGGVAYEFPELQLKRRPTGINPAVAFNPTTQAERPGEATTALDGAAAPHAAAASEAAENPADDWDSPSWALCGDTIRAVAFLQQWEQDGDWLLAAIGSESGHIESNRFDDRDRMWQWIERRQGKLNIYFTPNHTRDGLHAKASKDDITEAVTLHVDVDPKEQGSELGKAQAHILGTLRGHQPRFSVIVCSGNGYNAYWRLGAPLPIHGAADIAAIEACNIALANALDSDISKGDRCHSIDHLNTA